MCKWVLKIKIYPFKYSNLKYEVFIRLKLLTFSN